MDQDSLKKRFTKGTLPPILDGFYKGKLLLLLPVTFPEQLAEQLRHFYVPWVGKCFYPTKHSGDNILPQMTRTLLRIYPRKIIVGGQQFGGFHAFPFATSITKGLGESVKVLQLNYDLPENPPGIRDIIDEIVVIKENLLLGKVYLKEKDRFRLLGFFQLEK